MRPLRQPLTLALLLGSYDPKTKTLMTSLKEEIARSFSAENVYALLLDTVEAYFTNTVEVMTEQYDEDKATLFIFQENQLTEVLDIKLEKSLDAAVYDTLKKAYDVTKLDRYPVFQKLDFLMRFAKIILMIRHKEETRGGEYLELMHAIFRGHAEKIWFFKRNGLEPSAMLMEYLDKSKIKMRTYKNKQDLAEATIRILNYELHRAETEPHE